MRIPRFHVSSKYVITSKNLRTKKKKKKISTTDILRISSPHFFALLDIPSPPFLELPALSASRRNDQAPLRNTDDRVGIGGWALNHVLAVRKKKEKKEKNKRLSTSKLEFSVGCRGKPRVYADTVAITISRGINQRARKREERWGSIAPSRDHREIYSSEARTLSWRRSIPDWRSWSPGRKMHGPMISVRDTGLTLSLLVIPRRQPRLFIRLLETASLVHARVPDMCVRTSGQRTRRRVAFTTRGVSDWEPCNGDGDKNFCCSLDYWNFPSRSRRMIRAILGRGFAYFTRGKWRGKGWKKKKK